MPGNKAKQGWESKQKAYGEEVDVGGAKRGGRGCWAKVGALRRPAKSCGMGTSAGLLGLFSEHGQSRPLLETDGYIGKYHQLNVRAYEETCVRCVCTNVCACMCVRP